MKITEEVEVNECSFIQTKDVKAKVIQYYMRTTYKPTTVLFRIAGR